jgi:hypothetical protein
MANSQIPPPAIAMNETRSASPADAVEAPRQASPNARRWSFI